MTGYDRAAESLFVSDEGASAGCETVEQAGFWFADLIQSGRLNYNPLPTFLATHVYPAAGAIFPPVRPDWLRSVGRWLKRVGADFHLLFCWWTRCWPPV